MSALLAAHEAWLAALGLVLLLVPLLVVVAMLTFDRSRRSALRREDQVRRPVVMDERIRTRLEATIWPD